MIVPGLIVAARWFVSVQTFVFERRGPMSSLGRSWALTSGRGWPLFGLLLITVAISGAGALGALLLRAFELPDYAATFLGDTITQIVVLPLSAAISTAAYRTLQADQPIPSWV